MKRTALLGATLFAATFLTMSTAIAQSSSSSFSIAPPPIADPTFEAGKGYMRFSGQYLSVKMDNGFDQTGIGFNMVGRKATSDRFAFNFAFGMNVTSGKLDTNKVTPNSPIAGATTTESDSMSLVTLLMPMSVNMELQAYQGPVFNTILFGGYVFNLASMTMDTTSTTTITGAMTGTNYNAFSATGTMVTGGFQFGAQMGWALGDYHVDGFGMSVTQSGSSTFNSSYGSITTDIPAYTSTSFGADVKYVPWNLSLSSMVQNSKQPDNGYKMRMITLSWNRAI